MLYVFFGYSLTHEQRPNSSAWQINPPKLMPSNTHTTEDCSSSQRTLHVQHQSHSPSTLESHCVTPACLVSIWQKSTPLPLPLIKPPVAIYPSIHWAPMSFVLYILQGLAQSASQQSYLYCSPSWTVNLLRGSLITFSSRTMTIKKKWSRNFRSCQVPLKAKRFCSFDSGGPPTPAQ